MIIISRSLVAATVRERHIGKAGLEDTKSCEYSGRVICNPRIVCYSLRDL